jgi:hypothetical protein
MSIKPPPPVHQAYGLTSAAFDVSGATTFIAALLRRQVGWPADWKDSADQTSLWVMSPCHPNRLVFVATFDLNSTYSSLIVMYDRSDLRSHISRELFIPLGLINPIGLVGSDEQMGEFSIHQLYATGETVDISSSLEKAVAEVIAHSCKCATLIAADLISEWPPASMKFP